MRRSARLCGAVANLREALGPLLEAGLLAEHDRDVAAVQAELGQSVFSEAWSQGKTMALEEIIAYALHQADDFLEPQISIPERPTSGLRVFALGPTGVYRDERLLAPADWTFAKPKELLFYLLAETPADERTNRRGDLARCFTGPASQQPEIHLIPLAESPGAEGVDSIRAWTLYLQSSLDYWYDVEVFESCLARARELQATSPAEAVGLFEQAKQLYQGTTWKIWPLTSGASPGAKPYGGNIWPACCRWENCSLPRTFTNGRPRFTIRSLPWMN
jgi:hypothetical protein